MYTYAFFKTPTKDLSLLEAGIAGDVQVIRVGALAALVEPDLDLDAIQQNDSQLVQAVLTHDRVICDLFWKTTILPLRFGTSFVSQVSLMEYLDTHQELYLSKLSHFEGKAEYRLKLVPLELDVEPLAADVKGKQYLLAKKQRYQAQLDHQTTQQQEFKALQGAIAEVYPNSARQESADGTEKLYLLCDRQAENVLYEQLQHWQNQCPHWELVLGEALPPYHFV